MKAALVMSYLNNDDPKLYQSAQNSISEHLFPKMFPGVDPQTPTYCVPVTNPVEHPYLQISSYPYAVYDIFSHNYNYYI